VSIRVVARTRTWGGEPLAGLLHLRIHPIGDLEIFSGIGEERPIARMIDGFHRRDGVHHLGIMAVNVLHQLGLGVGRAGDEDGARAGDRIGDRLQESLILRGMSAADGIRFVMDMSGRTMRVENHLIDFRWAEMEYARFMMIYPDDGVKVLIHNATPFLNQRSRRFPSQCRKG
jgi:hypothetical protein